MKRSIRSIFALGLLIVILCMTLTCCSSTDEQKNLKNVEYTGSESYMAGKYYSQLTGVKLTGNKRTDIVNIAKSQLGYQEGTNLGEYSGEKIGSNNCTEFGRWYTDYKKMLSRELSLLVVLTRKQAFLFSFL